MHNRRVWFIATAAAAAAFIVANALEAALIQLSGGDPWALIDVSDAVLSLAVLLVTYLWLRVRSLRGQLTSLERERVAVNTELALAARIQRAALDGVGRGSTSLVWFAETRPTGRVGGDFYDLFSTEGGATLILVADVSGKGVPAAIGLASARAAFRMMVQDLDDPQEIVRRWSRWLYADTAGAPYLTALLVRLDPDQSHLTYVNAGHPAGLLLWPGGERRLAATCAPLGLMPALDVASETLDLPRGALGLLVTDGVTEALEDGSDPLDRVAAFGRASLSRPPEEVVRGLLDAARVPPGSRLAPPDDLTVMAFRLEN